MPGFAQSYDRMVTLVGTVPNLPAYAGTTAFTPEPRRMALAEREEPGITRRFHVIGNAQDAMPHEGGAFSGNVRDDRFSIKVQVAYYVAGGEARTGGAATSSDEAGIDRVAMDDLNRLRQHLQNPANFDAVTTGILHVRWNGTNPLPRPATSRVQVYEIDLTLTVRHPVLT